MTHADLSGARRIQLEEGWNQTLADWELFLRSTPHGCFVALAPGVDDGEDRIVGTVTSILYGNAVGWISMLLVDRQWRGRGIASELMQHAIAAGETRCDHLRLDATPAGRPVYEKLGFRVDYQLERWTCDKARVSDSDPARCTPLEAGSRAGLVAADRLVSGCDRSILLGHLISGSPRAARVIEESRVISGYVLGRPGEKRYQVGPIATDNGDDDRVLLDAGCAAARDRPVVIDIMSDRAGARALLEERGFQFQRPFTRMTRGGRVAERCDRVFAIAGPEFG